MIPSLKTFYLSFLNFSFTYTHRFLKKIYLLVVLQSFFCDMQDAYS